MKRASVGVLSLLLVLGFSTLVYAGPGSVVIKTEGDITATFGAQVRMIPTTEIDWDFGIAKSNPAVTGNLLHVNEAGQVNKSYIRGEERLYFNFAKGDIWDVYFALEWDDVLSSRTGDRVRDVQGAFGSFGLEKLNASIKLPWIYSRFNTGWDNNGVDVDLGALVYFDDDPGFYLKGGIANIGWYISYDKKIEANRTLAGIRGTPANLTNTGSDHDRDIISARLDYTLIKDTQVGMIFSWNNMHAGGANFVGSGVDPAAVAATNPNCGLTTNNILNTCAKVDGYYLSPFVKVAFAGFKFVGQYVHLWGDANETNFVTAAAPKGNYEIDSNAAYADLSFDLTPWTGFRVIPHIGGWWTQGDNNPNDNKLSGYAGVTDFQRFSSAFGGENTIIADGNPVYGSGLYGFLPILRGNQSPNLYIGAGSSGNVGRGDNPGILIVGGGITVDPIKNWTYRTNAMYLRYQENSCVTPVQSAPGSVTNVISCPAKIVAGTSIPQLIDKKDAGIEWDNEVLWWLDKNMVVKGQFSFLFPGDGIKQITRALASTVTPLQPDATAVRLAMELIWNF
jgi:hypothetical protein